MDRIKAVTLNAWCDAIEEMLENAHDDLMDLEYADEACAFYNEDEVWEIMHRYEEMIKYFLHKMRKELQDDKKDRKDQLTELEIQYAQKDDELIRKDLNRKEFDYETSEM